jgi:hypothetical protein
MRCWYISNTFEARKLVFKACVAFHSFASRLTAKPFVCLFRHPPWWINHIWEPHMTSTLDVDPSARVFSTLSSHKKLGEEKAWCLIFLLIQTIFRKSGHYYECITIHWSQWHDKFFLQLGKYSIWFPLNHCKIKYIYMKWISLQHICASEIYSILNMKKNISIG